jgi:hypothetical protein
MHSLISINYSFSKDLNNKKQQCLESVYLDDGKSKIDEGIEG